MNFKIDFAELIRVFLMKIKGERANEDSGPMQVQTGMFEINLVPDVKMKMIRLQKIRNLVFFVCIVIVSTVFGLTLVLGGIKGAQDIAMGGQDSKLKLMSEKILNYGELSEFLTIQDQLDKLNKIDENKKVLSRVFMVLSGILPSNDSKQTQDSISLSDLNVDLANSSISFDAQADAKMEPLFDYRVLESFKKGVGMMKYDYGRYVDENGNEIPTRCIEEADQNGNMYTENGNLYAIWKRGEKGCDPNRDDSLEIINEQTNGENGTAVIPTAPTSPADSANPATAQKNARLAVKSEKIWRTPQFNDWYEGKEVERNLVGVENTNSTTEIGPGGSTTESVQKYSPRMTLDGVISGIPHFASRCIEYTGVDEGGKINWSANNDCMMAPNGILINDSSNGRTADGALVLRFSAVLPLDKKIFAYNNKHVAVISPSGQNVTDSYLQIGGMFAENAKDCVASDTSCRNQKTGGN